MIWSWSWIWTCAFWGLEGEGRAPPLWGLGSPALEAVHCLEMQGEGGEIYWIGELSRLIKSRVKKTNTMAFVDEYTHLSHSYRGGPFSHTSTVILLLCLSHSG